MHSRRLLDLLVIGLSALSVAEATFVHARADAQAVRALQQRQEDEGGDSPTPNATNSGESNTPSATPSPSSTPAPEPSSQPTTPSTTTSSPTEPSTTTEPPQTPPTSKKPSAPSTTPTTQQPPETSPPPDSPAETSKSVVRTITTLFTVTNSDGSKSTIASEVLTTAPPGLAENNTGNNESGMSTETRNTVIGVVVGIGGAIVLVGLGFVAWRIWGRKKNQEEQDGLMDYTTPNDGKSEVGGSMSGRTPFQSTLESYHAPTQVNQAANF